MLEFESKRKLKKRLYSNFTLVVLLIIFFFIAQGAWGIYQKQRQVSKDVESSKQTLQEYYDRKSRLDNKLDRINTEVGQEEILREKYSLAKEGEKAIFLIDSDEPEIPVVKEESFMKRIRSLFNGLFN